MDCAAGARVFDSLASIRQGAAAFLDSLSFRHDVASYREWCASWAKLGDYYFERSKMNGGNTADLAQQACLCGLIAFEVAKRLADLVDIESGPISDKIEAGVQWLESDSKHGLDRAQIVCCDQSEVAGYYFPPSTSAPAPAVICIAKEEEGASSLIGRLLPVVLDRRIAILIVSHQSISASGSPDLSLSSCFDFLSFQPQVDPLRIGVYGEGLSAVMATDFAAFDSRVAAAICDGGLWNWSRIRASIDWITSSAKESNEDVLSRRRSQRVRRVKCPILVVAGGRGIVSLPEAIGLQNDCLGTDVDLELAIPPVRSTSVGEIENFITSDDNVFRWLERKLTKTSIDSAEHGRGLFPSVPILQSRL